MYDDVAKDVLERAVAMVTASTSTGATASRTTKEPSSGSSRKKQRRDATESKGA